jgi:hypothetical protein
MAERPIWKAKEGELWFKGKIIKRIGPKATSQRAAFNAFQAGGWQPPIENPLRNVPAKRQKNGNVPLLIHRIHELINSCNDGLPEGTIRFIGDGTGTGMGWKAVK